MILNAMSAKSAMVDVVSNVSGIVIVPPNPKRTKAAINTRAKNVLLQGAAHGPELAITPRDIAKNAWQIHIAISILIIPFAMLLQCSAGNVDQIPNVTRKSLDIIVLQVANALNA